MISNRNMNTTPLRHTFTIGALLVILAISGATSQPTNKTNPVFRAVRSLSENVKTDTVPCKSGAGSACECPGSCMAPMNTNASVCKLNKCYGWDENLAKCAETGPKFTPAIVLQAIPFTGVFGSGFGNMQRWDIFGIYMAVAFGPIALLIIACCFAMAGCCNQNEDRADCCKCIYSCIGCLWGIAILVMWVWGIVVIANKEIMGPNGCSLN